MGPFVAASPVFTMSANAKAIAVCICVLAMVAAAEVVNPADALVEEDALHRGFIHGTAFKGKMLDHIRSGHHGYEEGRWAAESAHAAYQRHSRADLTKTEMHVMKTKKAVAKKVKRHAKKIVQAIKARKASAEKSEKKAEKKNENVAKEKDEKEARKRYLQAKKA